jgi:uncharacterized protein
MQLKLLWDLQQLDVAINTLKKAIEEAPPKSGVDEAEEKLEQVKAEHGEKDLQLKADRKNLKDTEMRIQKIVDDRKELNENMYDGKGAAKELEQMLKKMDLLAEEKKKLEDITITLMESVEEQEESLNKTESELSELEINLRELKEKLSAELLEYNTELAELEQKRNRMAEEVEPKELERYTMLSQKHQGRPLAMVENDICGACRVFISSALRGKLYNPDAIVYCENCGRLLIKMDDPL